MTDFATYVALVAILLLVGGIYVIVFGLVMHHIHTLITLISGKRADRKILKTAERCRRDFA